MTPRHPDQPAAEPLVDRTAPAAIAARAVQARGRRPLYEQAERVAAERAELQAEEHAVAEHGDTRRQRRSRQRTAESLDARALRLLRRDDDRVRAILARKGPLQAVLPLAGTTPCDELLWFTLEHLDLQKALADLAPPTEVRNAMGEPVDGRTMYAPGLLSLLGLLARWAGLASGPQVQAALLCDERWMAFLGFNAQEVREGATQRSASLRGKTRDENKRFVDPDAAGPVREDGRADAPRGALSSQTLAGHEAALPKEAVAGFYDAVVRALVRTQRLRGKREVVVDTTLCEVPPSFPDAGRTRRKVKVQSKARKPRSAETTIYGFKVWTAMDAATGLVLAVMMDTADKPDNLHVFELLQQAQANLGEHAHIAGVALDRGFVDGDLLHKLAGELGMSWLAPAKAHMQVTAEARQRVAKALQRAAKAGEAPLDTAQRMAATGKPADGIRFYSRTAAADRAPLCVAQVDGLECTDWYGPGGADSSRLNSKDFRPTPLHATVVLSWPDRPSSDTEDAAEHDAGDEAAGPGPLVLLSPVVEPALSRFDRYDQRSLIENRVYRDGKQHFALGTSQARNVGALWSATVLSLAALMLHRGLQAHTEAEERRAEDSDRRAPPLGVLRYRRLAELRNRDKVLVMADGCFALLELAELMRYAGFALG